MVSSKRFEGVMRKAILMMLLAVVSSSAAAGWVVVDSYGTHTAYADPASIHRQATG